MGFFDSLGKIAVAAITIGSAMQKISESVASIATDVKRLTDKFCGTEPVGIKVVPGAPTTRPEGEK